MKLDRLTCVLVLAFSSIGALTYAANSAATTDPGAHSQANRGQIQKEIQVIRADIQALKMARQNHDNAAAIAAFAKLKTDWSALPPAVRERIRANHPQIAEALMAMKTLHADGAAIKDVHQSGDKSALAAALAKLKADLAALPDRLRELILRTHPALARFMGS